MDQTITAHVPRKTDAAYHAAAFAKAKPLTLSQSTSIMQTYYMKQVQPVVLLCGECTAAHTQTKQIKLTKTRGASNRLHLLCVV